MGEDGDNKTTCETYLPPVMATLAGVTGAIEGAALGGLLGAVPSAAFQAVGGYKIGEWMCEVTDGVELPRPDPTPNQSAGTTSIARK